MLPRLSAGGEDLDRAAAEVARHVAAQVLLGRVRVAGGDGGPHRLVLGADAGAVVRGVLADLQRRPAVAVGLVPQPAEQADQQASWDARYNAAWKARWASGAPSPLPASSGSSDAAASRIRVTSAASRRSAASRTASGSSRWRTSTGLRASVAVSGATRAH
jgi:hypothetical protein